MSNSELPSDGTLSLWFSCWSQQPSHASSEEGAEEEDVFEWLTEHVFCDDISPYFNANSIHLMDPFVFENVCEEFSSSRDIDFSSETIVWNIPEAQVDQTILQVVGQEPFNYTIWNVSFPTYRWGDPETQRKFQRSFELKLLNNYIAQDSLDGCRVAVVGKEAEFWLANRIHQSEKDVMLTIGILLFVLQTIALFLVPRVGKKLVERDVYRRELLETNKEEESRSEKSIDEMLITSKGYLDMEISNSSDEEKAAVPVGDYIKRFGG